MNGRRMRETNDRAGSEGPSAKRTDQPRREHKQLERESDSGEQKTKMDRAEDASKMRGNHQRKSGGAKEKKSHPPPYFIVQSLSFSLKYLHRRKPKHQATTTLGAASDTANEHAAHWPSDASGIFRVIRAASGSRLSASSKAQTQSFMAEQYQPQSRPRESSKMCAIYRPIAAAGCQMQ